MRFKQNKKVEIGFEVFAMIYLAKERRTAGGKMENVRDKPQ